MGLPPLDMEKIARGKDESLSSYAVNSDGYAECQGIGQHLLMATS